jgi:hypothetical protein
MTVNLEVLCPIRIHVLNLVNSTAHARVSSHKSCVFFSASRGWTVVHAPRVDLCASGGPIPHPNFEASGAGRPHRRSNPTRRRFLHTRRPFPPSNFEASGADRPHRRSTRNFLIPSPVAFFFSSPSVTYATRRLAREVHRRAAVAMHPSHRHARPSFYRACTKTPV